MGAENPQRRCLCRGSGGPDGSGGDNHPANPPPEAAGSSPATGDPPGSSFQDSGRGEARTTATKELSDPRGRAAECEDGEVGRIQREEGREGEGEI